MKISDLILPIEEETQTINFNGNDIAVKQYLPIEKKIRLISDVISQSFNANLNGIDLTLLEIYSVIEIVKAYTDVEVEIEEKTDIYSIYDALELSGLYECILEVIPEEEYVYVYDTIEAAANQENEYRKSIVGLLDGTARDYSDTKFNIEELVKALDRKEDVEFLGEVLDKMG